MPTRIADDYLVEVRLYLEAIFILEIGGRVRLNLELQTMMGYLASAKYQGNVYIPCPTEG